MNPSSLAYGTNASQLAAGSFTIHEEGICSSDSKAKFADFGYGSSIQWDGENTKEKKQMLSIRASINTVLARMGLRMFETTPQNITTIRTIM
jgi:hypothetical protein